jgi:UDP-N-acetylmuramate--alanine ligase
MNFGHIKKIHFVGIGGIGMSGIAGILASDGFAVSGCDLRASPTTDLLERRGIRVFLGHDAAHVPGVDLVVNSSAVKGSHPEVLESRRLGIPVVRRAEMLGEIMRWMRGVAIAGTHGKTTTSAMVSMVLADAGLDPTVIVGGMLRNLDTNAMLGTSDLLVVEADEYDRSFLTLHPHIAVITNIESDHLDIYRDLDDIRETFARFADGLPFYGTLIGCADDENVAALLSARPGGAVRYGLGPGADLQAVNMAFSEEGSSYDLLRRGERLAAIRLAVPGDHNVRNSLAAVAVGLELGVPAAEIARALGRFRGVERRFQLLGQAGGALVVDDYAHHPTEIRATLDAARRGYPGRRIVALFQPHLYTRTRDFHADFATALETADLAFVAAIYAAREQPIEGLTSSIITDAATSGRLRLIEGAHEDIAVEMRSLLGPGDLFITMGAGDINRVAQLLVEGRP